MIETVMIDREFFCECKQIAPSCFDKKMFQIIRESQLQDIKPLLGRRLFYDLLASIKADNTGNYDELLDGGFYGEDDDCDYNPGIKKVLVEYAYARMIMFGDVINNPFNFSRKINPQKSEPIDYKTRKSLYVNHRQYAYSLWLEVQRFLKCSDIEKYDKCISVKPQGNFNISKIGRT